ncbi:hypothetical protein BDV36DRAFT_53179 [Aspergillus pseudocaelatus]|uniref:Uncharacterized protein n=1 Tax=Aspergillus pseudocaelatus TaxID=1825620 RepID=A0ABQ6W6R2_9EURO|nr:hypothetical protein BDV36DRAFT_53179 [Aspergillus pseudocaelatus]
MLSSQVLLLLVLQSLTFTRSLTRYLAYFTIVKLAFIFLYIYIYIYIKLHFDMPLHSI